MKQYEQMHNDCIAYAHDLAHVKALRVNDPPTNPPWHKLDAMWLIKQDINHGKHSAMASLKLYKTRDEYQQFDLKTFDNHIYQEVDS
jgi:hypothetical protein